MPADVTALIATCNRAHYLGEALDSVLGQTVPPAQVIVVNDGSTDHTAQVLRDYGNRIEMIEQENSGKSRALNRAMPFVRSAYLWIFDDDDIALPHSLERHLAVLEADAEAGFVYSGCSVLHMHADGRAEDRGRLSMPQADDDEIFPRMLEQNFMQQQGMLVRTHCYRKVGPFDENLDRSQDYEMNLRLARRFPGRALDEVSFLFREHGGHRGRPGAEFAADGRSLRWIAFSRALLPRLRAELELGEYLPRSLGAGPLDTPRRRRALLQRACVAARCALWDDALADFGGALVDIMPGAPLDAAEQDLCRRALGMFLQRDLAIEGLLDNRHHMRRFERMLAKSGNADAQRIFAARLSLYAREKLSHGKKLAHAGRALALAWQVDGARSLVMPAPMMST